MRTHTDIYIYICVCVCVCVRVPGKRIKTTVLLATMMIKRGILGFQNCWDGSISIIIGPFLGMENQEKPQDGMIKYAEILELEMTSFLSPYTYMGLYGFV